MHSEDSFTAPCGGELGGSKGDTVIVDTNRLLVWDACSREIVGEIPLHAGHWSGLCLHRVSPDEVHAAVSDTKSNAVEIVDIMSGRRIRTIAHGGNFTYFICLHCPPDEGAALLLVSNECRHCIDVYDWESGAHVRSIGSPDSPGGKPGQLFCPGAIVMWTPQNDPAEAQVVVADSENHRLQFFRVSDGQYIKNIGGRQIQLMNPWALAIRRPAGGTDADAMLVSIGCYDGLIHVYAAVSGEYLRCIRGRDGTQQYLSRYVFGMTFYRPADAPETETQLVVSDRCNHRLQIFNLYTGAHLCTVGGEDSTHFGDPRCMSTMPPVDADDAACPYLLK